MSDSLVLGDLLALTRAPSARLGAWLGHADPALAARLDAAAAVRSESLAQFVRIAVADFMAEADEEAWASLMSAVRDARDPGAACVDSMTAFRIAMEAAA